jgi:hypothetical protein
MSMSEAKRHMPASAGRVPIVNGEATLARTSDEAPPARHETESTRSGERA